MADARYMLVSGDTKTGDGQHMHNSNDTCACDWGPGDGGACWDICNCSCCSLYCCLCWYFCGLCTLSKFYAHSMKQRCAIVNHCLPVMLFPFCFQVITRHNIRKQRGIGDTESCAGWCGDCCIMYWCGLCALGQELRATNQEAWDWMGEINTHGISVMEDPCILTL